MALLSGGRARRSLQGLELTETRRSSPIKILITGVAGFIGSNLAANLLARGHQVVGIDHLGQGSLRNLEAIRDAAGFEFIHGDLNNPLILNGPRVDVLVHLASQKIPRYSSAQACLDENSRVLKYVLEKCLRDRIRLVYASTSDVYGKNPNVPFDEESDLVLGPTRVRRWAYALSKIYGEHTILAHHEEYGLEFTIGRPFGSYGPNQHLTWWGGPQAVFIGLALKGEALPIHGDGLQTRTFSYVSDTVDILTAFIEKDEARNEIFNVGAIVEEETTILDLGKRIWRLVHGPASQPRIDLIPYETFGRYEDVRRRVPCNQKVERLLGITPRVGLDEGLTKTIEWQRSLS